MTWLWRVTSIDDNYRKYSLDLNVLVKLSDYSTCHLVLPTGTKGFAGTEGYMSPEIKLFNGEETYSEKIDCF